MTDSETGYVKWFDPERGIGLIVRDDGGDVYVHYSAVICEENDCSLEAGDRVRFSIVTGARGLQAQNVVVISYS